jgi:hypothetical protein
MASQDRHPIPATLDEWLCGWVVGKRGNPYRKIGSDMYVVYRRGRLWGATIGKRHSKRSWPSEATAKEGIYAALCAMSDDQRHRAHMAEAKGTPDAEAALLMMPDPRGVRTGPLPGVVADPAVKPPWEP